MRARRAQDRALDLRVGAAAAEVPRHRLVDLLPGRPRLPLQQGGRAHDLARRAEAALECVLRHERLLYRRGALGREPLDRHDLVPCRRLGEEQAGVDGLPVDEHGTGAAGALAAGELRPEELEIVAEDGEQAPTLRLHRVALSVDLQGDGHPSTTTGGRLSTSSGVGSAGAPSQPDSRAPRERRAPRGRLRRLVGRERRATTEATTTTTSASATGGCTDVDGARARARTEGPPLRRSASTPRRRTSSSSRRTAARTRSPSTSTRRRRRRLRWSRSRSRASSTTPSSTGSCRGS